MKTEIKGYANMLIEKYDSNNISILAGRCGSGKTYQVTKYLELDDTKKLLLASSGDCKHEFLNVINIEKVPYYETLWGSPAVERFKLLLNILEAYISNNYDVIILDNVLFESYNQISAILDLCLQYPNTKFFILLNEMSDLKYEEIANQFFIE